MIEMDRDSLSKMINNVISNTIKYSYPNKKIYISIERNILSIKDEGIGIKQEELKEIFKRYKRFTNISGGFGIGLDIVVC